MSLPRFLVAPLPLSGQVVLDEAESRHATQVLRLSAGDSLILFDGVGGEAEGQVLQVEKRAVLIDILRRSDSDRELSQPLEMLVALPKGDRQKTLVDGLVQLGATRLIPLICTRGVAQPSGKALARLQRSVIESSKQCGRNRLMEICEPQMVHELAGHVVEGVSHLFAHPYGTAHSWRELSQSGRSWTGPARIAIGPEGGFTEDEVTTLAAAGWTQISLGPRILRIEMAALQCAAWWASQA